MYLHLTAHPHLPYLLTSGLCLLELHVLLPGLFSMGIVLQDAHAYCELPVEPRWLWGRGLFLDRQGSRFLRPLAVHTQFGAALALGGVAHWPLIGKNHPPNVYYNAR